MSRGKVVNANPSWKTVKCDKCSRSAVIFVRYSGMHLCSSHLDQFVLSRAKKSLREQVEFDGRPKKMTFAVSGGKDSLSVMDVVKRILDVRRDVEFSAITIDEGIAGYRPSSIEMARKTASKLDVPLEVRSFKDEFGATLDRMAMKMDDNPCSVCGVFRRKLLNDMAKDHGADYLVTGLNLDDTAQTVLMNLSRGDTDRINRMGPHLKRIEGLVPRIQPLMRVPEKEIYLYAMNRGLPLHDSECPFSVTAERLRFREAISFMEDGSPGTRHGLVKAMENIKATAPERPSSISTCSQCNEPSSSDPCSACQFIRKLRN